MSYRTFIDIVNLSDVSIGPFLSSFSPECSPFYLGVRAETA